jgi:DNA-binding PadR family transcriptional regulator
MAKRGLIDEAWGVTDTNREAKFYKLTAAGRKQLRSEVERWERHARAMALALGLEQA